MATTNDELKRSLNISRLINAPLELVWEVWTEPDHIKNWWGPNGFTNTILKMDVQIDGEWIFIMHGSDGTDYKSKHIYKEIIPFEKLVLEHVIGPSFELTITFEARGKQTLVNITSRFESAEALQKVIKEVQADKGLLQNIDRMESYVTNYKSK